VTAIENIVLDDQCGSSTSGLLDVQTLLVVALPELIVLDENRADAFELDKIT
jgi:hypothetical protein